MKGLLVTPIPYLIDGWCNSLPKDQLSIKKSESCLKCSFKYCEPSPKLPIDRACVTTWYDSFHTYKSDSAMSLDQRSLRDSTRICIVILE